MGTLFLTKEAKIYNGAKTASSINGAGKTGQLHVKVKMKVNLLSHVRLFAIPWTAVYHASLSMGFSRQEYWSGLPFPNTINKDKLKMN